MDETVLITGASSGIGCELARLFAAQGCTLLLAARREDRLRALADELKKKYGAGIAVYPCDLAQAGAAHTLFDRVSDAGHKVDVLVNNAGFGTCGRFAKTDVCETEEMITLNVTALTVLTRLFVGGMVARRRGCILNVASVAGFQPGPLMAVYYATKAYVLSFSEALAEELRGTGVSVTCLCPGPTVTEFQKRAGMNDTMLFSGPLVMTAPAVARAGFHAMRRRRVIEVPGMLNKILAQSHRFAPRFLVRKIAMILNRRAGRDR